MQTLNFQCGHCRNLMAVGVEFLGQQVRCPHCGGVVVAPGSAPPAAATPEPSLFAPLGQQQQQNEDIFTQQSETEDALFGNDAPKIEVPRDPAPTFTAPPDPVPQPAATPAPAEVAAPTATWMSPNGTEGAVAESPAPAAEPAPTGFTNEPSTEAPSTPRKKAPPPIDWFFPLVFMPLILYAVVVTGVAIFMYFRLVTERPSIFDRMPDGGDQPGVKKMDLGFTKQQATAPLPDHLRLQLGETQTLGGLEVTPLRVEKKTVAVRVEGSEEAQACQGPSLVLHLRLKNVARDYAFVPIDNYFDRRWDGKAGPAPLTVLQAGSANLFGGPAEWYPLKRERSRRQDRQWVEGRENGDYKALKPGESMETFVCTDGDSNEHVGRLFGMDVEGKAIGRAYRGKFFWRVHLRRGLIDHNGKKLPAACVVGVEFTDRVIKGG